MNKITENIYMVQGRDEMLPDCHMYVIGKPSSKDLTMIDSGLVGKGGYKLGSIAESGVVLEDIKRIILTHTHLDHSGCLKEIFEKMPWVELWVHGSEGEQLETGDERTVYGMEMFKTMCQSQFKLKDGDYILKVHRKLNDGEELKIGGMTWTVIHIPGHSAGCIALYEAEEKILIPGDVVYADHAIGRFDLHGADPVQHLQSLKLLSELDVKMLLPGHNRIMNNVPGGYIKETLEQWKNYLR
jgi:glyoxylase-like metal-dependent hydrolase (beta-lactamase superfamily II)